MVSRRKCYVFLIVSFSLLVFFRLRLEMVHQSLSLSDQWLSLQVMNFKGLQYHSSAVAGAKVQTEGVKKSYSMLLTMVVSAPQNKDRRDAIRETWKNSYIEQGKQFDVKFAMGMFNVSTEDKESILAENEKYNDLVLFTDHLETYQNLTRKVLQMFVWADQNMNYSYLLKTDDDSFVRLDAFESELSTRRNNKGLYWGRISVNNHPQRSGKWKEDNWKLGDIYLPFAFGGGYVLSADLIHRIAINADGIVLYNNEDVSVGAWVSSFELKRKHDTRFDLFDTTAGDLRCRDSQILIHYQSIENMKAKHERLLHNGTLCKFKS